MLFHSTQIVTEIKSLCRSHPTKYRAKIEFPVVSRSHPTKYRDIFNLPITKQKRRFTLFYRPFFWTSVGIMLLIKLLVSGSSTHQIISRLFFSVFSFLYLSFFQWVAVWMDILFVLFLLCGCRVSSLLFFSCKNPYQHLWVETCGRAWKLEARSCTPKHTRP